MCHGMARMDVGDTNLLITKRILKNNAVLRQNQRTAKKLEKRTRLMDFRPKIYKITRLVSQDALDLSDGNSAAGMPLENDRGFLQCIDAASLVGLSGGGFPAAIKIGAAAAAPAKDKYLIVNAVACDPGLLHDDWILKNRWKEIEAGIAALCSYIPFRKILVASHLPVSFQTLQNKGAPAIEFPRIDYFYPMGEEHFLIKQVLGREIGPSVHPSDNGILVLNIQTVFAIGNLARGNPFSGRYLTAMDLTDGRARIIYAPFGTNAADALESALGPNEGKNRFLGDGVMNCHALHADDPITPQTNCLIYAVPIHFSDPSACMGCGTCQRKCPLKLPVAGLIKAAKYGTPVPIKIQKACIRCNACGYFCKAGIDAMRYMISQ